jgi:predicted O-methyltransferase YrrM
MQYRDVIEVLSKQPWGITSEQGKLLYDFIIMTKPETILELGTGIGTSACYMAAALDENGTGNIVSIDSNEELPAWVNKTFDLVNPELKKYFTSIIQPSGYNYELMKMLQNNLTEYGFNPVFDFCFIDGAHTWQEDGFAFSLTYHLLKPGGWILFDDLTWTMAQSAEAQKHIHEKKQIIPEEIQSTPQMLKVWELLVLRHPGFIEFKRSGDWGWARKKSEGTEKTDKSLIVDLYENQSLLNEQKRLIKKILDRLYRKLFG